MFSFRGKVLCVAWAWRRRWICGFFDIVEDFSGFGFEVLGSIGQEKSCMKIKRFRMDGKAWWCWRRWRSGRRIYTRCDVLPGPGTRSFHWIKTFQITGNAGSRKAPVRQIARRMKSAKEVIRDDSCSHLSDSRQQSLQLVSGANLNWSPYRRPAALAFTHKGFLFHRI